MRGSRRGEPLSEAIPIVDQFDAFAVHRDQGGGVGAGGIGGADQDIVRIKRAGAVILGAIKQIVVTVRRQCRVRLGVADLWRFQFGCRQPDDGAVGDRLLPFPMLVGPGLPHQPLDHAEMIAQDMRHVGVGLAETDDDLEQLPDRAAGAAGFGGQSERAKPGFSDEIDLWERKGALTLAVAGALSDPVEKRVEIRRTEIEAMRVFQGSGRYRLVHWF